MCSISLHFFWLNNFSGFQVFDGVCRVLLLLLHWYLCFRISATLHICSCICTMVSNMYFSIILNWLISLLELCFCNFDTFCLAFFMMYYFAPCPMLLSLLALLEMTFNSFSNVMIKLKVQMDKCGDYFRAEDGPREFGNIFINTKWTKTTDTLLELRHLEAHHKEVNLFFSYT